jgi:hypothetical protein
MKLSDGVQTYVDGKRFGGANYAKGIQQGKSGFVDEAVLFGVDWRTRSRRGRSLWKECGSPVGTRLPFP